MSGNPFDQRFTPTFGAGATSSHLQNASAHIAASGNVRALSRMRQCAVARILGSGAVSAAATGGGNVDMPVTITDRNGHQYTVPTWTEFSALAARVSSLEKNASTVTSSSFGALLTRVATLENKAATDEMAEAALTARVTKLEGGGPPPPTMVKPGAPTGVKVAS